MNRTQSLFNVPRTTTTNSAGHAAYERSLEEQYLQMLLTNTFGQSYYTEQKDLVQQAHDLHVRMMKQDPVFMAQALIFARNAGYMRTQPIYGLSILAGYTGPTQVRSKGGKAHYEGYVFNAAFRGVIRTPSDLSDFMVMINSQGRGEGGRRIKGLIAEFLSKTSEYWGLKYNGRDSFDHKNPAKVLRYNLGDAIATSHPRATDYKQNQLFRYLLGKDNADLASLPQIAAFEALKKAKTDEERISLIYEGRLPYNVVTGVIPSPSAAVWKAILRELPIFALLRHLNALDRAGLMQDKDVVNYIRSVFTNREALAKSKILPYRFLTALDHVTNAQIKDVLRQAVELTFENLPEIDGRTAVFLDVSSSMWDRDSWYSQGPSKSDEPLKIGAVNALALFKRTGGDGPVWGFNKAVYDLQPSMMDTILTQADKLTAPNTKQQWYRPNDGTDTSAPIKALRDRKEHVENIIMITDEQHNTYGGQRFYEELKAYRNAVNPKAKAFIINVAPERGAIAPQTDRNTYYIYGFSDQVLSYVSMAIKGFGGMVEAVRNSNL